MKRTRIGALLLVLFATAGVIAQTQPTTGIPPFQSFGGGPDVINLANLNVHWSFPVFSRAGRGIPFSYALAYDSSVWALAGSAWYPSTTFGLTRDLAAAVGYAPVVINQRHCIDHQGGGTVYYNAYIYSSYTDAAGTLHHFPLQEVYDDTGTCIFPPIYTATTPINDGSGMTITVTDGPSASVTLKSGQVISPPVTTSAASTTQSDPNGNEITSSTNGSTTTFVDTISDSTGTQVPVLTITGVGSSSGPVTYSYTSPKGTPANVTVSFKQYWVQTNFGCSGVTEYPATQQYLVDKVTLPDMSYYQFGYELTPIQGNTTNVTARIASIQLPTGGSISYNYQGYGSNGVICADGSTAGFSRTTPDGQWTYSRSGSSPNYTTTITDPSPQANQTVINFSGQYETLRSVYAGTAGGAPLAQVTTCYNGTTASPCPTGTVTAPFSQITVERSFNGGSQSRVDTQYDGYENVKEKDEYDFGATSPSRKTTIQYASLGNGINNLPSSVTVTDGSGNQKALTTYFYDQFALQTSNIGTNQNHINPPNGTPRGNLTTVTTSTSNSSTLSQVFTYYDTGKLYTAADVNNVNGSALTTYTYGNCAGAFPTALSLPLSQSRSMNWNCVGGVMTSSTDENLQVTSYKYQNDPSYWRPDSATDQLLNVTGFTYTNPTTTTPAQTESTLTFGSSTVDLLTTLDPLGRVQFSQRKQGPSSSYYDTVYTTYDSVGRPYTVTVPYQGTAKQTGGSGSTTTTYDAMNRSTQVTDGGGAQLNLTYTKNDVYREVAPKPGSDNNTKRRNLEYDGLGRLKSVCEVTSNSNDSYWSACNQNSPYNGYLTTYTYDASPNFNSVSFKQNAQKGTSQSRTYVYDMIGRLTSETNPETGQTLYYYDTAPPNSPGATCSGTYNRDLVKVYDAQGNTICYTYDALHRVTSVTYPAGPNSGATPQKNFVYDVATASGFTLSNTKTRLAEAYTGTSSSKQTDLVFSYSARGEATNVWESTPHSGGYYAVSQAYWPNGVVETLNGFLGVPTISYGVDGEGRIDSATVPSGSGQNPANSISYNTSLSPAGALSQVTFGSGDYDTYLYVPATGRIQKYTFNIGSPAQTAKGVLTWNMNGTIGNLAISDQFNSANSQTCLYSYDDLGRIASANCGPLSNQTFTFDPFGNIAKNATAGTSFLPTYNLSTNQYSSVPSCSPAGGPSYDLNGNPTNDCEHAYTYSSENQPVSIDTSNTFVYDALGRMVETVYTGGNTEYIYAPTGEELALANGQTLQKALIRLPGGGEAIYKVAGSSVTISHYRHADWMGSARFSSTPTQTLYYDVAYAPYGETYAALIGSGGNNSVSFAGQGKDTTTDLYPFLFRQYNSIQSRWVWPDPAAKTASKPTNPQTLNRYAYVGNAPLTRVDPLGLHWTDVVGSSLRAFLGYIWSAPLLYYDSGYVVSGGVEGVGDDEGVNEVPGAAGGSGQGPGNNNMTPSSALMKFLASCEGFSGTAYADTRGNCTIGYGHLLHLGPCTTADNGLTVTQTAAMNQLNSDVAGAAAAVNDNLTVPLTQGQFDAMVSLTFNMGMGRLQTHDVWTDVSAGNMAAVPADITSLNAGGPGIAARRANEADMFENGTYASACYANQ